MEVKGELLMSLLKKSLVAAYMLTTPIGLAMTGSAPANAVNVDGICSALSATSDRLFIESRTLLSHDDGGRFQSQNFASDPLPAGTYNIAGVSYDDTHADHNDPRQINEQWTVNLYNAAGEIVYTSNVTPDVPEDTDRIDVTLGTDVQIDSDVVQIEYVHAYGPEDQTDVDPADYIYNSVVPACVGFTDVGVTVVEGETTVVNQVCTLTGVFDQTDPAKLTLSATHQGVSETAVVTYQVNWGDDSDVEVFAADETMMHVYTDAGTYDVVLTVFEDDKQVAVCDDPDNIVENDGVTVVLGASTDEGSTAVLAATGVSPSIAAVAGLVIISSTAVAFKKS